MFSVIWHQCMLNILRILFTVYKCIPTMKPWAFTATGISVLLIGYNSRSSRFGFSHSRRGSLGKRNNVRYKWGGAGPAVLDRNVALGISVRRYTSAPGRPPFTSIPGPSSSSSSSSSSSALRGRMLLACELNSVKKIRNYWLAICKIYSNRNYTDVFNILEHSKI